MRKMDWPTGIGIVLVCLLVLGTTLAGCESVKAVYAVSKLKATPFYVQAREAYMNLPKGTQTAIDEEFWEPSN